MTVMSTSYVFFLVFLAFASVVPSVHVSARSTDLLGLTVKSNKGVYNYMEPITLYGNFTQDGIPVSNGTVGIAVYDPSDPPVPVAIRTVKTGEVVLSPLVNFVELFPSNETTGTPKYSFMTSENLGIFLSVRNYDAIGHYIVGTITIFDANGIPLAVRYGNPGTLGPGALSSDWIVGITIPASAKPGNATIVACLFSNRPEDGGVPYCEEKRVNFEIKRNPELGYSNPPMTNPPIQDGAFASSFRLANYSKPGDYQVYVAARSTVTNGSYLSLQTTQNTTFFSIIDAVAPPQAEFTYYPVDSFVNMSITFDASGSYAQGYNVSIIKYDWDFGDGNKSSSTNPVTVHQFTQVNNWTVTLNVTDSQGLWSTTAKPIRILPPVGPQADFLWYPASPQANQTVAFDATVSKLGWNGTGHPPIVSYTWDFGDGNITAGYYPIINHTYTAFGNYAVKLNITDFSGFTGYANNTVSVRASGIDGDINGDGTVDIFDAIILSANYGKSA